MKHTLRLAKVLWCHPLQLSCVVVLVLFSALFQVLIPRFILLILRSLESGGSQETLWWGTFAIFFLYVASEGCNGLRLILGSFLGQRVLVALRASLHEKLMRLSASFFDRSQSGELSSRLMEDVAVMERSLLSSLEIGLRSAVTILGVAVMLFATNALLALFVFAPIPFLIILSAWYSQGSRKVWRTVRDAVGEMNGILVEDIQGRDLVRSFSLQERERKRFGSSLKKIRHLFIRAMRRWAIYNPSVSLVGHFSLAAVVTMGGWMILEGKTDFGFPEMTAFVIWAGMLYVPIAQMHELNHLLAQAEASGSRVYEVVDAPLEVAEPKKPLPLPLENGVAASFRDVDFAYGKDFSVVLENFSLDIEQGKTTALVGHTGSGKTTLAQLLLRAYDASSGAVCFNGVNVRDLSFKELNACIGYVAQEPFLFESSIRSNLELSAESLEEVALWQALENACAADFVRALPQTLDTHVGERGVRLSQGEKQRLTLARVFLKNPPFLILDEATASLDSITENLVQQALDRLLSGRTVLVIAHRLSTIRNADTIVVLEKGRVLERGTHKELLLTNGRYAQLWLHQADLVEEKLI